jgi:hypothetical protein
LRSVDGFPGQHIRGPLHPQAITREVSTGIMFGTTLRPD